MNELEKLQDKAKKLIEQSADKELREMVFYWHGDEFLAEDLRRGIGNCEYLEDVREFVNKFRKKSKPVLYVDEAKFCCWYFDEDTIQGIAESVMNGETVSLETLLEDVGYLPLRLINNPESLRPKDKLYTDKNEELEDPGTRYELKLWKNKK
jgi:hypothetical protein